MKPPLGGFFIGVGMSEMVHIEGMAGVKAALARFNVNLQDKALRASLRDAGDVMQEAVTESAPVRPELPSGTALPPGALKADITLSVSRRDGVLMAVIQPGKLTRHVARWVEYGHRLVRGGRSSMKRGRLQGPGKEVGQVPAHPFIRPAFESHTTLSVQAFIERLKSELKRRG